jgi:hypothetical protein
MRLEPLYRITFGYRERFGRGDELLLLAEGRCEGRVTGRFRGANRARLLAGGAWLPELEGAVRTKDGATILLCLTGRGRPDAEPVGRVVGSVTHTVDDPRYAWLNETVGAVAGEVFPGARIVLDVAALVWEPLAGSPRYDLSEA